MKKIFAHALEAIHDISDNSVIMSGGFGLCGNPENLILALLEKGSKDLTIISNNCGTTEFGLGVLLKAQRIKKMISSYVGENKIFEHQYLHGELEVELIPQGTFAEKIRCGGAGIPAFYTPTGVGTLVAQGGLPIKYDTQKNIIISSEKKEEREFNNKKYILEKSLRANFALIKAHTADIFGNLVFNKSARNFNPLMATAADITIVEVENLVKLGDINPEHVHLSGAYVDRIIVGTNYQKWIEQRTVRKN